jgi:thiamine-phosphate pyrophosphorylase
VIRCLITDGTYIANPIRWLAFAEEWIREGIELLQIRERDLSARELAEVTRKVLGLRNLCGTKILVNDRADVAIACGAHGVHLRDNSPALDLFTRPGFLVTVSCHLAADAEQMKGADYILLAPIFKPLSKDDKRPTLGTGAITAFVRRSPVPVLALGGITPENARACVDAGAAGIAGITYFGR